MTSTVHDRRRRDRLWLRWLGGMVAAASAAVLVAACSGGGHSTSSATGGASLGEASAAASAGSDAKAAAGAPAAGAVATGSAEPAAVLQRDVVRTATMGVTVADISRAADSLSVTAGRLGGRVDGDDRSFAERPATATMVLRVPPAALSTAMSDVDKLGRESSRTVKGVDVTSSAADLAGRIAALTTSQNRLLDLMSHSGTVAELQSLENQLTSRQEDLQSLRDQQRALSDKIALATLTVTFTARVAPTASRPVRHTVFSAALATGWNSFTTTVHGLALAIGYSLPYLITLALAAGGWIGWRLRRRRIHRRGGSSTGSVSEPV